jgi:hypothetical protein
MAVARHQVATPIAGKMSRRALGDGDLAARQHRDGGRTAQRQPGATIEPGGLQTILDQGDAPSRYPGVDLAAAGGERPDIGVTADIDLASLPILPREAEDLIAAGDVYFAERADRDIVAARNRAADLVERLEPVVRAKRPGTAAILDWRRADRT